MNDQTVSQTGLYTSEQLLDMYLTRWLETSQREQALKSELDAMHAEYEALYDGLREEISQWRLAVGQIHQVAGQATDATDSRDKDAALHFARSTAWSILDRYPVRLTGDDESESDAMLTTAKDAPQVEAKAETAWIPKKGDRVTTKFGDGVVAQYYTSYGREHIVVTYDRNNGWDFFERHELEYLPETPINRK